MVRQRIDIDNLCDVVRESFSDVRFAADSGAFFAKLQVSIDEVAEQCGVIECFGIKTSLRATSESNAVALCEITKPTEPQICELPIPHYDMFRRHSGFQ